MAASESDIIAKLKAGVAELFHSPKRDTLSVKIVRNAVAKDLGLDDGFFLDAKWKEKSKKIIIDQVEHLQGLEDAGESVLEPTPEKKKPVPASKKAALPTKKRSQKPTATEKARPTKRQKKQATPSDDELSASSALSDVPDEVIEDFGDSDLSEAPKHKKAVRRSKTLVKKGGKKRKLVDSDDEEDKEESDLSEESFGDSESDAPAPKKQTPVKKATSKKAPENKASKPATKPTKSKGKVQGSESESENDSSVLTTLSDSDEAPTKRGKASKVEASDSKPGSPKSAKKAAPAPKSAFKKAPLPKHDKTTKDEEANASDSSEMSIVLDEAPKPKRKRNSKGDPKEPKPKTAKAKATPKTSAPLSPQEEQIKTLQSHLVKCGIRKIWAFELKQYGDDSSAKIKHLSKMLKDAGMVGRFSESRAREIKEMRELQADLLAVKEGEKSWGMESGRRSRSNATKKSMKISSEDEDDEGGDSEASGKGTKAKGRDDESDDEDDMPPPRARRQNDLDFLGSESESD